MKKALIIGAIILALYFVARPSTAVAAGSAVLNDGLNLSNGTPGGTLNQTLQQLGDNSGVTITTTGANAATAAALASGGNLAGTGFNPTTGSGIDPNSGSSGSVLDPNSANYLSGLTSSSAHPNGFSSGTSGVSSGAFPTQAPQAGVYGNLSAGAVKQTGTGGRSSGTAAGTGGQATTGTKLSTR